MNFDVLPTEAVNPWTRDLDIMTTQEILLAMNAEDRTAIAVVASRIPEIAAVAERAAETIRRGGRLIYAGAGTSGRLAMLDAAECVPTFGLEPGIVVALLAGGPLAMTAAIEGAEDDVNGAAAELARLQVSAADMLVGIAASGATPYVLGAICRAKAAGAFTVGLTSAPGSPLAAAADLAVVLDVGPEVLAGSTRLKAGTAQKMVLNMISTAAMVRLGKVYRNLMVDVRPTNAKLRARALRIVRDAGGVGPEEAAALLEAAGGNAKTAIVMARTGAGFDKAMRLLAETGGSVRAAVERAKSICNKEAVQKDENSARLFRRNVERNCGQGCRSGGSQAGD